MPKEGASSETLLDSYGEYHLAALGAEPRAEHIAAEFGNRQRSLRRALEARLAAERAAQATEALKIRGEADVEAKIRELELFVFAAARKNRKSDLYLRFFPKNLTGAIEPTGAAQVAEAERLANLAAPLPETPPEMRVPDLPEGIERIGTELRALCAILRERIAADEAAAKAVAEAFAVELSERRRWREQYRKDHGLLTALMPGDARTVESFFRKPPKTARKKEKPPEAT